MSSTHESVGSLAARSTVAAKVLSRHGIDICCGGARPFDEACVASGLEADDVLAEIIMEEGMSSASDPGWADRPLPDLIRHIIDQHHATVRREIPRLQLLVRKVAIAHATHDGDRLRKLIEVVDGLAEELLSHMDKEEQILFPWIQSGRGASAGSPIRVMQAEHESAARSLAEIRRLTDDFAIPADACASWKALLDGLAAFDADLREHIHLENNVLFPRALAG